MPSRVLFGFMVLVLVVSSPLQLSGQDMKQERVEKDRQLTQGIQRLAHFLHWPDKVFAGRERGKFQIGVEESKAGKLGKTVGRLNGQTESWTRTFAVSWFRSDRAGEDLQRFEMILLTGPEDLRSCRQRTENGHTVIVGLFPGAIEAGCAVEIYRLTSGEVGYRINLAELKARNVEATGEFLRTVEALGRPVQRKRVPIR